MMYETSLLGAINLTKLHKNMSVEELEKGYFYATELKAFAKELGIDASLLRKNELEDHIKNHLLGKSDSKLPRGIPNRKTTGSRDVLLLDSYIVNYISDSTTKKFLKNEIAKLNPTLKDKSGQWYWLNDWRKTQIRNDIRITYQNLIDRLHELMLTKDRLPRIPSTRFNNFITDFLADPNNNGINRKGALQAWKKLKKMPIPKNYLEYKKYTKN